MKTHGSFEFNLTAGLSAKWSPRHQFFDPFWVIQCFALHHPALFNAGRHQESERLFCSAAGGVYRVTNDETAVWKKISPQCKAAWISTPSSLKHPHEPYYTKSCNHPLAIHWPPTVHPFEYLGWPSVKSPTFRRSFLRQQNGAERATSWTEQRRKVLLPETTAEYRQTPSDWWWYQTLQPDNINKTGTWSTTVQCQNRSTRPASSLNHNHRRHSGHGIKARQSEGSLQVFLPCTVIITKLNVFFLSQSFDNIKDMKINANFLYLFRFPDKANVKRHVDTLFGVANATSPIWCTLCMRSCWRSVKGLLWP